jgi:hypothetical protein
MLKAAQEARDYLGEILIAAIEGMPPREDV